jgi:Conserved hypothetical ATP binding protein
VTHVPYGINIDIRKTVNYDGVMKQYGCCAVVSSVVSPAVVCMHALTYCGCVVVWLCGCVVVWLCGCVVVWLCGCVVVWLCGCVDDDDNDDNDDDGVDDYSSFSLPLCLLASRYRFNLGPNGAILTSLNLFATKFDQVLGLAEKRSSQLDYVFLDTPGQIEVFTWSASGQIITESLGMHPDR